MIRYRANPPMEFDPQLITDPTMPVGKMSAKKRKHLEELREAYRWALSRKITRQQMISPEMIAAAFVPLLAPLRVEHLWALPLDSHMRAIAEPLMLTKEAVNETLVPIPDLFRALLAYADTTSFIMLHNHPTGSPEPSAADKEMTEKVSWAGKIVGIRLQDHVIISATGEFTSLRREQPGLFQ